MRIRTGWLGWLVTAGVVLAPSGVRGQEVPPADPVFPLPLYHSRPEKGGFYAAGEFVFFRQDNPLKNQPIAVRGILDFDGSITADLNGVTIEPLNGPPIIAPGVPMVGTFIGSGTVALNATDASGPLSYEPGFRLTTGWKFAGGAAVEFSWMSLVETKYNAVATLVPPTLNAGTLLQETFLFSPVFNFPNDFAGPQQKLALGNPNAAYGIWNGASVMSIDFVQRYSQYDITSRIPVWETDCCRCYGLVGPRYINMWERFRWRTVSEGFDGASNQSDVALYSNVVSNQMYGVDVGIGTEWYLGHGFSLSVDGRAAGMIDFVREIVKYERADFAIGNKRSKHDYTFVPELQASFDVWWYPIEGIQIKVGYELMGFFDTISSPQPVSFNYGGLDVGYSRTSRFFDGFHAGIGFIF